MRRLHYGWAVCAAATGLIFITMGTVSNGFAVYLPFIMAQRGLSHAQTSSLVTLRCLTAFFAMLGIGGYYRALSLRAGTALAAGCAGAAFFLYSAAEDYPAFCAGAAVSGLSYGLGSMIPVSILMARWFHRRRGLALSICATGSGLATVVLPPVTTRLVEALSLAGAFRAEAAGILVLTAVIFLVLRNDPADVGAAPYGIASDPRRRTAGETDGADALPPPRSLTRRMWFLMLLVSLTMGGLANPGFSHLSVLYTGAGFSAMAVAAMISGTGLMITAGKLLYGMASDRVGGRTSSLVFGGVLLAGHVLCCLARPGNLPLSVLNVLCLGVGYPIATIGPSVWAGDMASPEGYPKVVRRFQVVYAGGALLFAGVPGILADRCGGSYVPAYVLFSCFLALALTCLGLAYRERGRRPSDGGETTEAM